VGQIILARRSVIAQAVQRRDTGWTAEDRGSILDNSKIFLFSTASTTALGPTQPHIQWLLGGFSPGVKRPESEADHAI
jgi:hypothetical protein